MTIAVFDIVCAVLAVILVVRCLIKGFISEVMSMASVVLGILAAVLLYKNGAAFICRIFYKRYHQRDSSAWSGPVFGNGLRPSGSLRINLFDSLYSCGSASF